MKCSSGHPDQFSWTYLDILEDEATILTTIPASRGLVFGIAASRDYQDLSSAISDLGAILSREGRGCIGFGPLRMLHSSTNSTWKRHVCVRLLSVWT